MGIAVLLIHGHPFDHTMWDPQAAALRRAGYEVIAPDLRGYGQHPAKDEITYLSDFAADLIDLLDQRDITRTVVCGVSLGGQIAMELARTHPERLLALILMDTSPVPETPDGREHRRAVADRILAEGLDWYVAESLDRMITPEHVRTQPGVAAHLTDMMLATAPAGAAAAVRGRAERPDYRPTLAGVRVPTLVIVGEHDTYTPVDQAELIAGLVTGSTLAVVEDAAHLPAMEQPDRVTDLMLRFLEANV